MAAPITIRAMQADDVAAVERIYKARVAPQLSRSSKKTIRQRVEDIRAEMAARAVALVGVDGKGRVLGYIAGDVRSWEFGSEPAGWIFALGVDPKAERQGLGRALLDAAIEGFARLGISSVRTMVKKDDVPVLRFFRSRHFTAGPYVELEMNLDAEGNRS